MAAFWPETVVQAGTRMVTGHVEQCFWPFLSQTSSAMRMCRAVYQLEPAAVQTVRGPTAKLFCVLCSSATAGCE